MRTTGTTVTTADSGYQHGQPAGSAGCTTGGPTTSRRMQMMDLPSTSTRSGSATSGPSATCRAKLANLTQA